MILTDKTILEEIEQKNIIIEPFKRTNLGSNSYDVHLADQCFVYDEVQLDAKKDNKIKEIKSIDGAFKLVPGELYLMSTVEYTETYKHVPFLEGKSSTGRLGVSIHATAGKGDVGFCGNWTLEVTVSKPVVLYVGMPIGQLIYFKASDDCITPYDSKLNAKYSKQTIKPMASQMWKNFKKS